MLSRVNTPGLVDVLRQGTSSLRGDQALTTAGRSLRILFMVSAHNSLSQRALVALTDLGHEVSVAVVDSGAAMESAVERHAPELVVCPFLKQIIPESVWGSHRCLIVHPGPKGDRGPSSLDWAIELGMAEWGVTVLEATGEVDAGGVWAEPELPHARGRQVEPLPPRGPPRHRVGAGRGGGEDRRGGRYAGALGRRRSRGHRPRTAADATGRAGDRLAGRQRGDDHAPDPGSGRSPGRARHDRRRPVPSLRRAPGARAAGTARRDHRPARRRDLPRDRRRRAVDHASQAGRRLQAARRARTRAGGHRARRAGGSGRLAGADPAGQHVPRDRLHGARGRRLPALRLLQRRDEHRPVPALARRLPACARTAADERDRPDGRAATSSRTGSTST